VCFAFAGSFAQVWRSGAGVLLREKSERLALSLLSSRHRLFLRAGFLAERNAFAGGDFFFRGGDCP
jgi:hypothetical protein